MKYAKEEGGDPVADVNRKILTFWNVVGSLCLFDLCTTISNKCNWILNLIIVLLLKGKNF